MTGFSKYLVAMTVMALAQSSCVLLSEVSKSPGKEAPVATEKGYGSLENFPFREGWYGMYFHEDKVGYSHFKIDPAGPNFKISSDSMLRLTALNKTNEIRMREKVVVRPDLTLISFESLVRMNDKDLRMNGRVEGRHLLLDLAVEGEKMRREYPITADIYHSSSISLMPAMRGLREGLNYSFAIFNPEKQGMEKVEQQISRVRGEPGPGNAQWKVKNNYGRSVVYSWLDGKGLAILEKSLEGSLITMLEDEASAKKFQAAKTQGKDLVLDFSLIRVAKPIPNPAQVRFLRILVDGVEASVIPEDHRQKVSRREGTLAKGFEVTVRGEDMTAFTGKDNPIAGGPTEENLASTVSIQSDHREIVAQAEKIVSSNDPDIEKVRKLVNWTSTKIKHRVKDSFTALSVLRDGEGECQAHANLYTALARSQKIPTRVVTGLVYTEEVGFLYHAWAESYVNRWVAVDPTLNQVPADATHIKLYTGDSGDAIHSLLKMVGKVKIEVLEFK